MENELTDHSFRVSFDRTLPLHRIAKVSSVTLSMIEDDLRSCKILQKPKSNRATYRWAVDISDPSTGSDTSFQEGLVFICTQPKLQEFLASHDLPQSSLFIVLVDGDEVPAILPARSLVIKREASYSHYVKRIQGLFFATWIWEMEMSHIAYEGEFRARRGKLQELIDSASQYAPYFICITDTGFNLVAYSSTIEPPTPEYKKLIEEGGYGRHEIERLKANVLMKAGPYSDCIVCPPDDLCPCTTIHMPLFIDRTYIFHLTMVCKDAASVDACKDMFKILSSYVKTICIEFWNTHLEVDSSCHKVLIKLIEGKAMSPHYLHTQLESTVIPKTSFFRLLRYPMSQDLSWDKSKRALQAAAELFPEHCYPFMYRDDLLVLICSPTNNLSGISLRKTLARTTKIMYEPFGLTCAMSQPFRKIIDIGNAYIQTGEALRCSEMLKMEYPEGYDGKGSFAIIPFEHTLQFSLMNPSTDPDILSCAFNNSIIEIIDDEDQEQGGDFVRLLWEYLCMECNATDVAKKLNRHRNTVVYHINKFEKRFDISLELPMVRQRLYLDFVHHFSKVYS